MSLLCGRRCMVWPGLIDELSDGGAEVIIMRPEQGLVGTFWRFLTADEEYLDACLILDADSLPMERQKNATVEWLNSDKYYHIVRDHIDHKAKILAAHFGIKGNSPVILNMHHEIEKFLSRQDASDIRYGFDERFLAQVIYPRVRDYAFIHTDHTIFPDEITHPLPKPARSNFNFVGRQIFRNDPRLMLSLSITALKRFYITYAFSLLLDGFKLSIFSISQKRKWYACYNYGCFKFSIFYISQKRKYRSFLVRLSRDR